MNCYYHQNHTAVGICKNCSKGICFECASDLGNGIACKNKCEEEVKDINKIIFRGKRTHKVIATSSVISMALGIYFIILGKSFLNATLSYSSITVGVLLLLAAIFNLINTLKKR